MSRLLDILTSTPTPQKGKNGSGYVLLTDKNGTPIDTGNPLAVDLTVTDSVSGTTASDGVVLELDALAQTLNYNGDGTLNYIQVTYLGNTYRQSFTYGGGALTGISAWVKQ
jgi:hypothetical protein